MLPSSPLLVLCTFAVPLAAFPLNGIGRRGVLALLPPILVACRSSAALATTDVEKKPTFRRVPLTQYIAALGDPDSSSGTGADRWGLWVDDPGPRGVRLGAYENSLVKTGGRAQAGWEFDASDWWLEEHGLIMPGPDPLPTKRYDRDSGVTLPYRRYVVTGGRDVTTVLTVQADGRWQLDKGTLYDVTHLPCRSARYTPAPGAGSCTPAQADRAQFPVKPGAPMPPVGTCFKQDYAVLFVVGIEG